MTASQITDIIGQLTLEEKASLCPGSDACTFRRSNALAFPDR